MRLIDADETKHNLAVSDDVRFAYLEDFGKVCDFIDRQTTVDAVPVIRCKDCMNDCKIRDEWFCADGKRRNA